MMFLNISLVQCIEAKQEKDNSPFKQNDGDMLMLIT